MAEVAEVSSRIAISPDIVAALVEEARVRESERRHRSRDASAPLVDGTRRATGARASRCSTRCWTA